MVFYNIQKQPQFLLDVKQFVEGRDWTSFYKKSICATKYDVITHESLEFLVIKILRDDFWLKLQVILE